MKYWPSKMQSSSMYYTLLYRILSQRTVLRILYNWLHRILSQITYLHMLEVWWAVWGLNISSRMSFLSFCTLLCTHLIYHIACTFAQTTEAGIAYSDSRRNPQERKEGKEGGRNFLVPNFQGNFLVPNFSMHLRRQGSWRKELSQRQGSVNSW